MSHNTENPTTENKLSLADLLNKPNELYLLRQVAQIFNRHPETVRRWIKKSQFPTPLNINGMYYFKGSDLVEYINANAAEGV